MQAKTAFVIAEGVVAAVLSHLAITTVLLIGDGLAGRGLLFTPSLLGQVLFEGPPDGCQVPIGGAALFAFASVHLMVLTSFGLLGAALVASSERYPMLWFGALTLFVIVAWHLAAAVLTLLGPAQSCVSLWWNVAASFAGALVMGGYLWRVHPRLRARLGTDQYA
jgi:hypothetical protein